MSTVEEQLRKAASDMIKIGAKFAVVGGLAVSARAEPRMTRDADLAIAVNSDQEAEQVIFAMQRLGYSVLVVVEQEATGRMSTVRLETTGSVTPTCCSPHQGSSKTSSHGRLESACSRDSFCRLLPWAI